MNKLIITVIILLSLVSPVYASPSGFAPSGFGVIEEPEVTPEHEEEPEPEIIPESEEVIPEPTVKQDLIVEPEPQASTVDFMMANGFSPSGFQPMEPTPEPAPIVEPVVKESLTTVEPEPPQSEPQIIIIEKVVEKIVVEKEVDIFALFAARDAERIEETVEGSSLEFTKVDNRLELPATGGSVNFTIFLILLAGLLALMVAYYREGQR